MHLTWNDIKNSVRKLCFLTSAEYPQYEEATLEAANYAMLDMAKDFPIKEALTITKQSEDVAGCETYDMYELTAIDTRLTFLGVCEDEPIIKINSDGFVEAADCTVLADRFLLLPKKDGGTYKIMYKKDPERITADTAGDYEMPFEPCAANLLPLLMAWRILKDDDERKASMYYNEYINGKDTLKNKRCCVYPVEITEGVLI